MSNTNMPQSGDIRTTGEKAKQEARTATEDLKHRAQDVASTVASEAGSYADKAKGAAADEVKDVASALRTAANELRSGSPQERTFSQLAHGLADAAEAMRDKDLGEIVSSLNGFARRNPLIFLGSAALVGFAATRFAKATSETGADISTPRTPATSAPGMAQHSAGTGTDFAHAQGAATGPTTPGGQK